MKRKLEHKPFTPHQPHSPPPKTLEKLEKYVSQTYSLQLTHHTQPITTLSLSPNGKYLFSGSQDCKILLFHLPKTRYKYTFLGHSSEILSLAVSLDSNTLFSSDHSTLRIWSIDRRTLLNTLLTSSPATCLSICLISGLLVSAYESSLIAIHEVSDPLNPRQVLEAHSESSTVNALRISVDGGTLFSGHSNKRIIVWDLKTLKKTETLEAHTSTVTCLCINDRILVSGSEDKTLIVWTLNTFKASTLHGHKWSVSSVSFTPDNLSIVSGSYDNLLIIWNAFTHIKVSVLKSDSWAFNSVLCTKDCKFIVTAGEDAIIRLWDLSKKSIKKELTGHLKRISCFHFSADKELLATGSVDRSIRLWNLSKRKQIKVIKGHEGTILALKLAPNNSFLVSGSDDRTFRLWKFKGNSVHQLVFYTHFSSISCVSIFQDSTFFVSYGSDNLLFLYSIRSKKPLRKLKGLKSEILSISSTGTHLLVTQHRDNTWMIWTLKSFTKPY